MIKIIALVVLIAAGALLQLSGLLNPGEIIVMARQYTDHWWLPVVLVLLQVLLFTFALAGTVFLWVAAVLFPPLTASIILAAGATLGGVSAYYFSANLSDEWVHRVESSHIYKVLHKQDNFFALLAMRIMPAFPHGLVNYSSGILKVNLAYFVPATFIGIGLKSYVYAPVIYQAAGGASLNDLLDITTFGPLVLLSVFILVGVVVKYKWDQKHGIPAE
ncbi:MAG: VTT domain-containing protein [Gammaproteobacteria bacterium]|nr:VTT domain-containing protein [Gammaproteobacteria bacterium]